jgi:hypothetical protein
MMTGDSVLAAITGKGMVCGDTGQVALGHRIHELEPYTWAAMLPG